MSGTDSTGQPIRSRGKTLGSSRQPDAEPQRPCGDGHAHEFPERQLGPPFLGDEVGEEADENGPNGGTDERLRCLTRTVGIVYSINSTFLRFFDKDKSEERANCSSGDGTPDGEQGVVTAADFEALDLLERESDLGIGAIDTEHEMLVVENDKTTGPRVRIGMCHPCPHPGPWLQGRVCLRWKRLAECGAEKKNGKNDDGAYAHLLRKTPPHTG